MKKVLIITYYWPPSGGAGVQRWVKFVKYLPQFGIQPIVLSVKESVASYPYVDSSLEDDLPQDTIVYKTNSFEPVSMFSRLFNKPIPSGGNVSAGKSLFSKFTMFVRNNFFIPDPRIGWKSFAVKKAKEIIRSHEIDTIITSSPPHSTQLIGLALKKKFKNITWIADLRDPWTGVYYFDLLDHSRYSKAANIKLEATIIHQSDKIITVGATMKQTFLSQYPTLDERKISVITNGYDTDDYITNPPFQNGHDDKFIIVYTGTMSDQYNPAVFFDAVNNLFISSKDYRKKLEINIIGKISTNIKSYIGQLEINNITKFTPTVSHRKVTIHQRQADLCLLVIPDTKNANEIVTGKLFEYLGALKKIICIGPKNGDASNIINVCQAGKTFERTQIKELEIYLESLIHLKIKKHNIPSSNLEEIKKYSRMELTQELARLIHS